MNNDVDELGKKVSGVFKYTMSLYGASAKPNPVDSTAVSFISSMSQSQRQAYVSVLAHAIRQAMHGVLYVLDNDPYYIAAKTGTNLSETSDGLHGYVNQWLDDVFPKL